MPWSVKKVGEIYKLYNTDTKKYVNKSFNTKQSAINTRRNYQNYSRKKNKK